MNFFRPYFLFSLLIISACQSPETKKQSPARPPAFLAVRIIGEENMETVNCLLQVQREGGNTASQRLDPEEKVTIDDITLNPDSARYSGLFYEASFPINSFTGEHSISFTSDDGRTHSNTFSFHNFSLPELSELSRSEFDFQLVNFPEGKKKINLLVTDTSYFSEDLNTVLEVTDGRIRVQPTLLRQLKSGPAVMQIILEEEKQLKLGKTRGRLLVSYSMTRDFLLR